MKTYMTSEIARSIGIHSNTVRLYEELELIPKPERKENGYRIFTDFHMEQIKFVRIALKVEVLQNGLRKQAITIIKTLASGNFDKAIVFTEHYLQQIKNQQSNAEEAIEITYPCLCWAPGGRDSSEHENSWCRRQPAILSNAYFFRRHSAL